MARPSASETSWMPGSVSVASFGIHHPSPTTMAEPNWRHKEVRLADECFQQEVGKPLGRVLPLVRVLQFLPNSPDVARHACHGSGNHGSRLGTGGVVSVDTSGVLAVG